MWGSGDPGEERVGGSNDGLFVAEEPPGVPPRDTGLVVAWCLTIAGVLSLVGIVAELWTFDGITFTDQVVQYSSLSLYPVALVLAAAVAWSLTDAGRADGEQPSQMRGLAEVLLGLCAAVTAVASVYSTLRLLGVAGASPFDDADWPTRASAVGLLLPPAIIGAAALYVVARDRGVVAGPGADRAAGRTIELPPWRVIAPAVGSVFFAMVALVVGAVAPAFKSSSISQRFGLNGDLGVAAGPGPSIGDRIASVSHGFVAPPLVFAVLAVVVIVALVAGPRRGEAGDRLADSVITVAAFIGLVTVATAGYSMWRSITATSAQDGESPFLDVNWWSRAAAIAPALAAAGLGAAAGYVKRVVRTARPEPAPTVARFDPRVVAACSIIAALGTAIFQVIQIAIDDVGLAIGELLVGNESFVLLSIGLALAAVVVASPGRRGPNEPNASDAAVVVVDGVAATLALAALLASAYVSAYVLFGHHDSKLSFVAQSDTSQKVNYIALAMACALVAIGTLQWIWASRRGALPTAETDGDVEVVDLV